MTRKYYYDAILCYYDNFNARISTKVDSIFDKVLEYYSTTGLKYCSNMLSTLVEILALKLS